METSVFLPDDLVQAADSLAERLGMSRSELFATALNDFVAKHSRSAITVRLDQLYGSEPSGLEPDVRHAQRRALGREDW